MYQISNLVKYPNKMGIIGPEVRAKLDMTHMSSVNFRVPWCVVLYLSLYLYLYLYLYQYSVPTPAPAPARVHVPVPAPVYLSFCTL